MRASSSHAPAASRRTPSSTSRPATKQDDRGQERATAREQRREERTTAKKQRKEERAATKEQRKEERATAREQRKEQRRASRALHRKQRLTVATVSVLVLVLACVLIYPSAQEYYSARRANDKLQAEYAAVNDRNAQLQSNIDNLQTDDGIEEQAREYGWTMDGENAVNVVNSGVTESSTTMPAAVESEDVEAPDTWVTKILDPIFGVE